MNISYNRTNSVIESESDVQNGNILSVLAMFLSAVLTVFASRAFRAVMTVLCIVGAVVIAGLVEAGNLSFGKAIVCALLLGITEALCLRERKDS